MAILERVTSACMLLALALVPVFFVPVQWIPLPQAKMLLLTSLVAVAAVTWALRSYRAGEVRIPLHVILGAGLLLPLAYAVSAALSNGNASFVGSGIEADTLAAIVIWYAALLLSACVFYGDNLSRAVRALFAGGALLVLFQYAHLIAPNSFSLGTLFSNATSNLVGSWHDLSIFLGVLVLLATLGAGSSLSPSWRRLVSAVGVLSAIFLLVQNMTDVWIALAVVAAVALLVSVFRAWRMNRSLAAPLKEEWILVGLLVVAVLSVFAGSMLHERLPEPIRVTHIEVRPSWQGTFSVGQQSLEQPGRLFFGSGPNTFATEWNRFKPIDVNRTPFWNADFGAGVGTIPTSFVTVGIAGMLAWGIFLLAIIWAAFKFLRRETAPAAPDGASRAISYGALFLVAFLVVYTPAPVVIALTFVFLGLFIGAEGRQMRGYAIGLQNTGSIVRLIALAVAVLCILAASFGTLRIISSDAMINRGVAAFTVSNDGVRARSLIERALVIAPKNDRAHRAAVELGLVELQQLIASGASDADARARLEQTLSETIQHGLSAVAISGDNYQNWLLLASVYAGLAGQNVEGAYENARAAYARTLESNPSNPLPLLRLAQLEVSQNNIAAAREFLGRAVQIKPDYAAAFYLDSQINAASGDFQTAIAEAAEVARLVPGDATGWFNLGIIAYAGKQYDVARQALERSVNIQNDYANALYFLGLSYYRLGQRDQALSAFRAVQALNPDNADLKIIVDDLTAGRPLRNTSAQ